ncbi:MAG: ubiquinol-cytochrome c reductase iron-sulfur subunit, partial [Pirellulales bacterium]
RRVVRLDQLPVGKPKEFSVLGSRQDAWTVYADEIIGRVWLVRHTDESVEGADAKVDAYSARCPHLGCSIQFAGPRGDFVCPCHDAVFDLQGEAVRTGKQGRKNPAPRDMDSLVCRVVQDAEAWWIEVEYQDFELGVHEKVAT